ncbi:hypothetical protein [Catellatospora sp. NPDC049609]|uniref:hypothetical protein n=1 Tax=Catellatospora sp. NPDC049609 TaxID=3155505 RepID=UPI00343CF7DA
MSRALTNGRPGHRDTGGHPDWCEGAHHCTANSLPSGEHASRPEVWITDIGRFIGTRYRDRAGRDRMELRIVLDLAEDERIAQAQCRHLMALACKVVSRAFGHA